MRSHKHLLKTSPGTIATLSCEYDDGQEEEEEDGEAAKKKKKPTKRRTRREEEEEETERLRKKIEALEAELARQPEASQPEWGFNPAPLPAPSPTAFLEMLSSAATTHSTDPVQTIPGLRNGAAENAMMSTTWAATPTDTTNQSTGLTPFLSFTDNQEVQGTSDGAGLQAEGSRSGGSHSGPQEPLHWGPSNIEPATRTDGPWRAVETVETASASVFVQTSLDSQPPPAQPAQPQSGQPTATTGDFSEAMQQQLLLDLFWPGWPPFLPEPNIVNDL